MTVVAFIAAYLGLVWAAPRAIDAVWFRLLDRIVARSES